MAIMLTKKIKNIIYTIFHNRKPLIRRENNQLLDQPALMYSTQKSKPHLTEIRHRYKKTAIARPRFAHDLSLHDL